MLETYNKTIVIRYKGEIISTKREMFISEKGLTDTLEKQLSWTDLEEFYEEYSFLCPFGFYKTSKGRKIEFYDRIIDGVVKEWKASMPEISVTLIYYKKKYSINDILNYEDSSIAIRYLVEHALSVIKN